MENVPPKSLMILTKLGPLRMLAENKCYSSKMSSLNCCSIKGEFVIESYRIIIVLEEVILVDVEL